MIADIASGNTGTADVFFLIAVILFAFGAIIPWITAVTKPVAVSLVAFAAGFVALGFLVL
jgi:hypothetical protein